MLAIEGKRLIADYLAWLKEGFHTEDSPDHVVISTPFLDPHNDEMQIFVEKHGNNLRLSDDGYTMADLSDMGLDVNTDKREAHVRQILSGFGVHLDKSGELAVTATPRDFPQKKHNLMQAMLAMHDLAVMGQSHVAQFFEEDVAAYLRESGVSFFRNLKLSGRSGFDHHFDFGFSATSRRSESVMQAVNSLSRDLATSVAFAVNDVRLQRGTDAIQAYAIVNDRDNKPAHDYIDALKAYGIIVHTWNEREALLPAFGQN